jgi:hypothetical protein
MANTETIGGEDKNRDNDKEPVNCLQYDGNPCLEDNENVDVEENENDNKENANFDDEPFFN